MSDNTVADGDTAARIAPAAASSVSVECLCEWISLLISTTASNCNSVRISQRRLLLPNTQSELTAVSRLFVTVNRCNYTRSACMHLREASRDNKGLFFLSVNVIQPRKLSSDSREMLARRLAVAANCFRQTKHYDGCQVDESHPFPAEGRRSGRAVLHGNDMTS